VVLQAGLGVGRVVRSKPVFQQNCFLQNAGLVNKVAMASFKLTRLSLPRLTTTHDHASVDCFAHVINGGKGRIKSIGYRNCTFNLIQIYGLIWTAFGQN